MKHKIKVILSGLLISMGFYGNVVADEIGDLALKEAVGEISDVANTLFFLVPAGFLGLSVEITRELGFTGDSKSARDSLMRVSESYLL